MSASHIGLSSSSFSSISSSLWVLDSEASYHISPNLDFFVSLSPKSPVSIVTTDGTSMPIVGVGSIHTYCLSLNDVYHVHSLTLNLVFVSELCESGYLVYFSSTICYV